MNNERNTIRYKITKTLETLFIMPNAYCRALRKADMVVLQNNVRNKNQKSNLTAV